MINLNFADIIDQEFGPDATFALANEPRPEGDYLFEAILPERAELDYTADSATMTVRATMAGMAGMDSPYPPVGLIESSTFFEKALKIAGYSKLTEESLRRLQRIMVNLRLNGGSEKMALADEIYNFLSKVIVQSIRDRMEWLRAKALVTGQINWTFGQMTWNVSYGIPSDHILTNRTGTAAWDGSASAFWADIASLYERLNYDVQLFVMHTNTWTKVLSQSANNIQVTSQAPFMAGGSRVSIRRLKGDNERPSDDFRENIDFVLYGDEGEVFDTSNPGQTTKVPFMPTGKILAVGRPSRRGYVVGEGSTVSAVRGLELGYTHVAPTVEGGRPGIWAQAFTPEGMPMQLHGRGAANVIPVVAHPDLLAIASSDLS